MTLASFAVHDSASRGRVHPEDAAFGDSPFDLDRHRITTAAAFRRLMHKTQVFIAGESGDHFRTRLTHTLEVAAQAERLARLLRVNHRLAEAIALAHDLGHPPFGHAGELALAERMSRHGGFEHNLQSLRVVDYLEHPYPAFRGLNLSFELRESLVKHRTPFDHPDVPGQDKVLTCPGGKDEGRQGEGDAPFGSFLRPLLDTGPQCPLEGQIANLADAIAYTLHDIEDGIGESALNEDILSGSSLWQEAAAPVRAAHPSANLFAVRRPILDRLADMVITDAAAESTRRLTGAAPADVDAVRAQAEDLIALSHEMLTAVSQLQGILLEAVYRNHRVVRMDAKARRLVRDLFDAYVAEPQLMPRRFESRVAEQGVHRVVCDYIAGMTDRFCQQEHQRLFAPFHFD